MEACDDQGLIAEISQHSIRKSPSTNSQIVAAQPWACWPRASSFSGLGPTEDWTPWKDFRKTDKRSSLLAFGTSSRSCGAMSVCPGCANEPLVLLEARTEAATQKKRRNHRWASNTAETARADSIDCQGLISDPSTLNVLLLAKDWDKLKYWERFKHAWIPVLSIMIPTLPVSCSFPRFFCML